MYVVRDSTSYKILKAAAAGTLLIGGVGALAIAPGLAHAAVLFKKPTSREKQRMQNQMIREAARRLEKRGLVTLSHLPDRRVHVEPTPEGTKALLRATYQSFRLKPQKKTWDGMWRVVLFDVPEEKKRARDALRKLLVRIGFYPLQKSTFATPVSCRKEVEDITTAFSLKGYIIYLETDNLGVQELTVKNFFNL